MSDVSLLKAKVADLTAHITQLQADLRMVQTAFAEAVNTRAAASQAITALEALIRWALGEDDAFPPLPDDWPARKFYWREELRARLAALTAPEAKGMREDAP